MLENLNSTLDEARLKINEKESLAINLTKKNEILETQNHVLKESLNDKSEAVKNNLQVMTSFLLSLKRNFNGFFLTSNQLF